MSRPVDDIVALAYQLGGRKIGRQLVFFAVADIAAYVENRRAVEFLVIPIYRGRPLARERMPGESVAQFVGDAIRSAEAAAQAASAAAASLMQAAAAATGAAGRSAQRARCTCPGGDGSLVWPCPAHPWRAQAVPS